MATSDINTLLEQAKCFRCLSHKELIAVQTYIIAYASDQGMDPNTLLNEARCLLCLSQKQLFQIRAYLIANIGGLSTDPQELVALAQCYRCIPDGYMEAVRTYLFSLDANGPGTSDPDVLEANAATFTGLTPEQSLAIQVYLLANNAGLSTDPGELQDLAKCFDCLSFEVLNSVTTQVVDEVENDGGINGGGEPPIPPEPCVDAAVQQVPVLQNPVYTGSVLSSIDIRLPQVCCHPSTVFLYECYNPDGTDGVLYQTELIAAAHAGAVNYVFTVPIMSAFNRPYLIARQFCEGGPTSSDSNVIQVGDPAAANTLANAWSALVVTNGGAAPSVSSVASVSQFYAEIAAYGLGAKLKSVNLFAPDSFIASMTPQIWTWGATLWDKVNTVAKGFGACTAGKWGVTPDVTTGIWTGFNPAAVGGFSVNNFGVTLYTNHPDFAIASMGGRSASNYLVLYLNFLGGFYFDWPDIGGASRVTGTFPARFRGFISYSRDAANSAKVFYANRNTGFNSGGTSAGAVVNGIPNAVMYIGAFNDTGTWQAGNERGYGACAFHLALNVLESEKFWHAVENFRRAVGGGYIPETTVANEVVTEFENNLTFGYGTSVAAGTRTALVNFWDALIAAGIEDKMLTVCPIVPDSLGAALTPLVALGTYRNMTAVNFVAGDLTVNGLAGNALGKYINLVHWIPARQWFTYSNIGITTYIHTGKNEASNEGATANAAFANAFSVQNFANAMYSDLGPAGATGRIGPVAAVAATGYYSGNRIAANNHRLYAAKSTSAHAEIGNNLNASADVLSTMTFPMCLWAYNMNGTVGGYSSKRVSFWAAHLGLTSAESAAFYAAIQAFRTALGGGFV